MRSPSPRPQNPQDGDLYLKTLALPHGDRYRAHYIFMKWLEDKGYWFPLVAESKGGGGQVPVFRHPEKAKSWLRKNVLEVEEVG